MHKTESEDRFPGYYKVQEIERENYKERFLAYKGMDIPRLVWGIRGGGVRVRNSRLEQNSGTGKGESMGGVYTLPGNNCLGSDYFWILFIRIGRYRLVGQIFSNDFPEGGMPRGTKKHEGGWGWRTQ